MPRHERSGAAPAAAWARRHWRALLAETCATALLVALGVASSLPAGKGEVPLADIACAFGFVVVGCCVAFGGASGAHMNPAVSLAGALAGRLAWPLAGAYAAAQLLGAVLGFAALRAALPVPPPAGLTLPAPGVGAAGAAALEAALTALLALACCAAWAAHAHDDAPPDHAGPIKLGLLVAGLVYAGGRASGASLNPARSFAPALLHNRWEQHWVYWVGPLGGAALAAGLHAALAARAETPRLHAALAARAETPRRTREEVALADKP